MRRWELREEEVLYLCEVPKKAREVEVCASHGKQDQTNLRGRNAQYPDGSQGGETGALVSSEPKLMAFSASST
jgi:hypothetical protein